MKKTGMIIFLVLVGLLILFPTVGHVLPDPAETEALNENRALSSWPASAKNAKQYLTAAENWFNDHLAFRDQFIETDLRMNLALGESPTSTVLLGKNNWLFFVEFDEDKDVRRELTMTAEEEEELISVQSDALAMMKDSGASYYVLVAPNKQTIYPEYLPLSLQPGKGPTMLDQIYSALEEKSEVPCLDVRPALLAAKADQELYYHFDHHWNETGGYYAFLAIAERLKQDYPNLYIPSPEEITTSPGTFQGDLASMIGMGGVWVDQCLWYHFPDSHAALVEEKSDSYISVYENPDHPEAPKILFVHDSFGPALVTFLKESCSMLVETASDELSWEYLMSWEPDIVIFEKVERFATVLRGG